MAYRRVHVFAARLAVDGVLVDTKRRQLGHVRLLAHVYLVMVAELLHIKTELDVIRTEQIRMPLQWLHELLGGVRTHRISHRAARYVNLEGARRMTGQQQQ